MPAVDIRELRLNKGLSVQEAAEEMGIPHQTLARAESGGSTPQPRNALKIASFYGYKVTEVWPLEPVEGDELPDPEQNGQEAAA